MSNLAKDLIVPAGDASALLPQTIEFDGFLFNYCGAPSWAIACFEMAYRARRGCESAAATLNAFSAIIADVNGKQYWPMEKSP